MRDWTSDDDLFFAAMRILLPPYDGPDMNLFRGQRAGDIIGMSWTRSAHIAVKFALHGTNNVHPNNLVTAYRDGMPPRRDGIVPCADVDASRIICAPCLLGHQEGEFIVDPRGLDVSISPIGHQVAQRRRVPA